MSNSSHTQKEAPNKWQYYARLFKGFERSIFTTTAGTICAAGLLLLIPLVVRYVFNEVIPQERFGTLVLIALLAVFIHGAYLIVSLWVRRTVFGTSKEVIKKLRLEAAQKLYALSDQTYSHLNRAGLHAKLIIDIDRVGHMTEALIGSLIPSSIIGILLISGMLFISVPLVALTLLVFSFFVPVTRWAGHRIAQIARQHQHRVRSYSSRMEFSISHVLLTKVRSAEAHELAAHESMIEDLTETGRTLAVWRSLFSELQNFFAFTTAVVLLGVGVGAASVGWVSLGDVLGFYVMAMLLRGQYVHFANALTPLLEGGQAWSTIFEILVLEDVPHYQGTRSLKFRGGVKLQDVTFSYDKTTIASPLWDG